VIGPLVSVCLPNLNTRPYLQERIDTILAQTHPNWELVVSDNYSEDGAWAFFEELARKDSRVSITQEPREGMYANWNHCVRRAQGEYVYIATSDDGMAPDCLEKLVAALEEHPDCDVAHCALVVVDAAGAPLDNDWWRRGLFARSHPELTKRRHIRRAPYDGLLCLLGEQVYYSITQMLIRRSLFSRIGMFATRWGSVSDFNWYMRVGLAANTVYVPDTWASWRVHASQATAVAGLNTVEHEVKVDEMISDAVRVCEPYLTAPVLTGLKADWLDKSQEMRTYYRNLGHRRRAFERRFFQLAQLFDGGAPTRSEILGRLLGRPKWPDAAPGQIANWLDSVGVSQFLPDDARKPESA
jgi:glycosyltransferase involved in cell wall biosynthesis